MLSFELQLLTRLVANTMLLVELDFLKILKEYEKFGIRIITSTEFKKLS